MKRKNENNSAQPTRKESEPVGEAEIDANLEDSFPASDPPSWTLGSNHKSDAKEENVKKKHQKDVHQKD